jgi:CRP/FNR family cyclic AMP-dependent transcriptional regulator
VIEDVPVEQLERLLPKVDILESLPPEEVEHVALVSHSVHLERGEVFGLDENRRALLLLTSGRVRVHEPGDNGQDLTICIVEKGTIAGQTGFASRDALHVEALQPSTLLVLGWKDFEDLLYRNPDVGARTIHLLSERLAVSEERLSDLIRKEVPARLAGLILGLSEREGIVTGDCRRKIPTRYTHQQLASMVGSNREAVTRAFGRLRGAGAVEIRDRYIYVTDADALERFAQAQR